MSDNTQLNTGSGGDLIATDELTLLNGNAADAGLKVQRVKIGFGADGSLQDVTPDAPLPVEDAKGGSLLWRILQALSAPLGYDKSLQRQRSTTVVESGTVTTVTTVTTVSSVTNIAAVGGYSAQMQIMDTNRTAWAQCVRARIT